MGVGGCGRLVGRVEVINQPLFHCPIGFEDNIYIELLVPRAG